jgi:hypothetical protein
MRWWILLGILALLASSCIDSQQMKKALSQAARQAAADEDEADCRRPARRIGQAEVSVEGSGAEAELLDSLLRLAAQDVGINPKEGSVQKAIWRVRVIKLNLATARRSLDNSRQEIFGLAATAEELKALKELDERMAEADAQEEELVLERRRLQDKAIERAKADGRLQRKELSGDQAKRVGLLLYNLGVGVVCDNLAIRHSQAVLDDFQRVKRHLFDEGGWNGAMAWIGLAAYHKEFLAIPGDLVHIGQEAPAQLAALGAMIGTIQVLKENNAITEREVRPGDSFESLEDF